MSAAAAIRKATGRRWCLDAMVRCTSGPRGGGPGIIPYPMPDNPLLKRGSKGDDVGTCQRRLNRWGWDLDIDDDFGPDTEDAVRVFQRQQAIDDDGEVGKNTWPRLLAEPPFPDWRDDPTPKPVPSEIGAKIAAIAHTYRGQREKPGNSGWHDATFQAKMKDAGWMMGQPWCAYYAKMVWLEAYADQPKIVDAIRKTLSGGSVNSWHEWRNAGLPTSDKPTPGAIGYLSFGGGKGHTVICMSGELKGGTYRTNEGNSNEKGGREGIEVAERSKRRTDDPKLLGFILPPEPKV